MRALLSADGRLWEPYRAGLVEGGHDLIVARMTGAVQGWVSDDPEADWPVVSKHLAYQVDSYRKHMVEGAGRQPPRRVDPDRLRGRDAGVLDYFWCETPQSMASKVQAMIADSPTETVFFWASLGGMPEQWALRHVQTICTKLAPLLKG